MSDTEDPYEEVELDLIPLELQAKKLETLNLELNILEPIENLIPHDLEPVILCE